MWLDASVAVRFERRHMAEQAQREASDRLACRVEDLAARRVRQNHDSRPLLEPLQVLVPSEHERRHEQPAHGHAEDCAGRDAPAAPPREIRHEHERGHFHGDAEADESARGRCRATVTPAARVRGRRSGGAAPGSWSDPPAYRRPPPATTRRPSTEWRASSVGCRFWRPCQWPARTRGRRATA